MLVVVLDLEFILATSFLLYMLLCKVDQYEVFYKAKKVCKKSLYYLQCQLGGHSILC